MNYGQEGQSTEQPNSGQPFFTIGQGNNDPNRNNFESENNLDLTNTSVRWGESLQTPNHSNRNLGNQAIFSSTNPNGSAGFRERNEPVASPELGEIVTTSSYMPPVLPTANASPQAASVEPIKIQGDHLNRSGIATIDQSISELNQTGNIMNFYEEIRGTGGEMDQALANSFNRKLGA